MPIDVVTGCCLDEVTDFLSLGEIELHWRRSYDSSRSQTDRGLGPGFRHSFDRELLFDIDGLTYVDQRGQQTHLQFLDDDGQRYAYSGVLIERVSERRYRVKHRSEPWAEFVFHDFSAPARLIELSTETHQVEFEYEDRGRLSTIRRSDGQSLTIRWKDDHISSIRFAKPHENPKVVVRYQYSPDGRLLEAENAYGHAQKYDYDQHNRVTTKADRNGYSFFFKYDKQSRCVHSSGEDGLEEVSLEYLPEAWRTIVTKADGGKWLYVYAKSGAMIEIVDPYGGKTSFIQDEEGRIIEEHDPNGNITRYLYDETDAPYAKIDSLDRLHSIDEEVEHRDPLMPEVGATALEWEHGSLIREPFEVPEQTQIPAKILKNAAKNLRTVEQTGRHSEIRSDQGLLLKEELSTGKTRAFAYDPNGNIRKYRDFDGSEYHREYKTWNFTARETDPLDGQTTLEWTAQDELDSIADPGGTKSEYVYDLKNRLVQIRRHSKIRESYVYDKADNLIEKRGTNGELLISYEVAPGNLKASRTSASGETHSYKYNEFGRVIEAKTDDDTCEFEYSFDGHRSVDVRDDQGVEHRFTVDELIETRIFEKFKVRYIYPDKNTVLVVDPANQVHRIQKTSSGVIVRDFSNGFSEVSQYDRVGNCLSKTAYNSKNPDLEWSRIYDRSGEGDVTTIRDNLRGNQHITYDKAHRLDSIHHDDGRVDEFEYDKAGNLLKKPDLSEGFLPSYPGFYVDTSRVSLRGGNQLYRANGDRFTYDDRDHIVARETSDGTVTYHRDQFDRLRSIQGPNLDWHADYDACGRRIRKRVGDQQWEYFWDNERLAAEISPDGQVRIFVYSDADSLVPILFIDYENLDADPESGKRYFLFCNHLGAPEKVLDDKGETVWSSTIRPYGECDIETGEDFHQPLRWPGHFFDNETGLHYNRFRYYSPELGRYLESDPIGIQGGLNLYGYTENPLKHVDVLGLNSGSCPLSNPGKGANTNQEGTKIGAIIRGIRRARDKALQKLLSESGSLEGMRKRTNQIRKDSRAEINEALNQRYPWPSRTKRAVDEADVVENAFNQTIDHLSKQGVLSKKNRPNVISVSPHQARADGTTPPTSVGVNKAKRRDRDDRTNASIVDDLQQRLGDGYNVTNRPMAGNFLEAEDFKGDNISCAERRVANAARAADTPMEGNDTRWVGRGKNPHSANEQNPVLRRNNQMELCPSCNTNQGRMVRGSSEN